VLAAVRIVGGDVEMLPLYCSWNMLCTAPLLSLTVLMTPVGYCRCAGFEGRRELSRKVTARRWEREWNHESKESENSCNWLSEQTF